MNIIILSEKDKTSDSHYVLNDERADHINNVLKSEIGDIIEVGLLNGPSGAAKITEIIDSRILLEINELHPIKTSPLQLSLICALPRPQTLKKVLSTCATMGISNLYLIRSQKVEKSYFHSPLLNEDNYTKFLVEGLSQGKRTILPKISIHKRFKEFFNNEFNETFKNSTCLIAHPDTDEYLNSKNINKNKNILLAIGPEGGWNDFEVNLMQEKGFTKFKLSESILRVENAVTASLAHIELLNNQ